MGLEDPNKTYANLAEANRTSWARSWPCRSSSPRASAGSSSPSSVSDPHGFVWEYDYTHVQELQEALDAVHARTREDWKAGLITLNEAREQLGYDPAPDGDQYFPGTGAEDELDELPRRCSAATNDRLKRLALAGRNGDGWH